MHPLEALERELLQNSTRKNAERISQLLVDGFREFGSSGKIYSRSDIIATLQTESPVDLSLSDFEAVPLTTEISLVTYRAEKRTADGTVLHSLRSSIWISDGTQWRILFHQGTLLPGTVR
jgi:hypothetical protein